MKNSTEKTSMNKAILLTMVMLIFVSFALSENGYDNIGAPMFNIAVLSTMLYYPVKGLKKLFGR